MKSRLTPPGWKRCLLDAISDGIEYGYTASACSVAIGPKFLRITDIQNGAVNWDTVPFCEAVSSESAQYRLRPGDIVFARTGATTGKSFLIRSCPKDAVFASYLIRVRPKPEVDPLFLAYFFQTPVYWRQIAKHAQGAGQPGVNGTRLKTLEVALPPIADQKRIAAILDKADGIRRKRRETLDVLESYETSLFESLFSGYFRGDETAFVPLSDFVERFEGGLNMASPDSPGPGTKYFVLKVSAVTWREYQPDEAKPIPQTMSHPRNTSSARVTCSSAGPTRPNSSAPPSTFTRPRLIGFCPTSYGGSFGVTVTRLSRSSFMHSSTIPESATRSAGEQRGPAAR